MLSFYVSEGSSPREGVTDWFPACSGYEKLPKVTEPRHLLKVNFSVKHAFVIRKT